VCVCGGVVRVGEFVGMVGSRDRGKRVRLATAGTSPTKTLDARGFRAMVAATRQNGLGQPLSRAVPLGKNRRLFSGTGGLTATSRTNRAWSMIRGGHVSNWTGLRVKGVPVQDGRRIAVPGQPKTKATTEGMKKSGGHHSSASPRRSGRSRAKNGYSRGA
jgi:hypothetical protein